MNLEVAKNSGPFVPSCSLHVFDFFSDALKLWYEQHSSLPCSIIAYRDGVGDGQLQALIDQELKQMEANSDTDHNLLSVRLTFIVVKKRINTRFFLKKPENGILNPPPGTVIDLEFVKEGTVTPTRYNVIHDTLYLSPDAVQSLTYTLCHMYYNFSGVIRVPAPCHYAHKLAYLVGQSLHQEPHESLSKHLFYL
uniref:Piwi domain-containing protein n=1 Tax=Catagonus wagneri TaxID=51154 RepID=A0A8C3YRA6_9CETA